MVHILSLVLLIVLLYFVSIIKYYVKTVMLQSQYSELATITVHRKYYLSLDKLTVSRKYSPSFANIVSISRKYSPSLAQSLPLANIDRLC